MKLATALVVLLSTRLASAGEAPCTHRYQRAADIPEPHYIEWSFPIGAHLSGRQQLDFDGDGRADDFSVTSEVQHDPAVNPVTHETSGPYCWFNTRMTVRSGRDGRSIYSESWSIKFDDLGSLLETHGVDSPEAYFRSFFTLSGYFTNGIEARPPDEVYLSESTIRWFAESQKVAAKVPEIVSELRALKAVRTLVFRTSWREDLRVVAYVPSLARGVLVQAGYEEHAGD